MMQRKGTKTATSIENAVSIPHTAQMKRGGTKWEKGRIERKNGQNKFSRKYTIWAVTNKHTTMTATRNILRVPQLTVKYMIKRQRGKTYRQQE